MDINEYYGLQCVCIKEKQCYCEKKSIQITKNVPIIKNTLPLNIVDLTIDIEYTHKIEKNVIPNNIESLYIKDYNYIIEENTFGEKFKIIDFVNYKCDINKCVFPKTLIFIEIYNEYNIKITNDLFINNPKLLSLRMHNISVDNPNYYLESTDRCHVYINSVFKKKESLPKYIKILKALKYDYKNIENIITKHNNYDSNSTNNVNYKYKFNVYKQKIKLINNILNM